MRKLRWLSVLILTLAISALLQTQSQANHRASMPMEQDTVQNPSQLPHAQNVPTIMPTLLPTVPIVTLEPTPAPTLPVITPIPSLVPTLPVPTPVPSFVPITPVPTLPGGIQPGPNFDQLWRSLGGTSSRIGNPTQPAVTGRDFAKQYFQSGILYWLNTTQAPGAIWMLDTLNADFSAGASWAVFNDSWDGRTTYPCSQAANNGEFGPVRGFGTLWCNRPAVQADLGDPTQEEQGSAGTPPFGSLQQFQNGWMLYNPLDNEIYVLYRAGDWSRHSVSGVTTPVPTRGPVITPVPTVNPQRPDHGWQPTLPPTGEGSIAFINHHYPDQVTIAINRQQYQVPPKQNGVPGHVQIDLPPGNYSFTASIPGNATTDKVEIRQGRIMGVHVRVPGHPDNGADMPDVSVNLQIVDITNRAYQSPPSRGSTHVVVHNYLGQQATFTINNQQYIVTSQGQHTINLSPGTYRYTASSPGRSASGQFSLSPGQQLDLSISIDQSRNILQVYQN